MRRKFTKEFKFEAVLVPERGVVVAQAVRDLDLAEGVLRRWTREAAEASAAAFPGDGHENARSGICISGLNRAAPAESMHLFKGALFGWPCVVAIKNPPKDSVIHGETGFATEEPDPMAIAHAIEAYARDPEMNRRMGENGSAWAEGFFSIEKSGREFAALYQSLVPPDRHE